MTRRDLLKLGALSPAAAHINAAPRRRPNVLFLFADDQRFDTLRALGNPQIHTPNLDRLAHRGTAFTEAAIMGGTVAAVCAPSRAMLMTGQTLFHVDRSIVRPAASKPAERRPFHLFPELFRQHGYETFSTGKWHNGEPLFARCFTTGENIFFGGMSDHLHVPVADFDPSGRYPADQRHTGGKFSSELFSDSAIRFLAERRRDRPFLAYVSYTAPHDPRMAPREFAHLYPPSKIVLPPNFLPRHPFDNGELEIRDETLAPWPRTPEIVREHIAAYFAMITHLDAQIGRVMCALEDSGETSNTIVVFAGDNGLALGQHGLLGKQNLYEASVRVPLVIAGPGLPKGARSDALCYLYDLFPTLCDLASIPAPDTVEGSSLAPLLHGRSKQVRDSMFFAYKDVQRAVKKDGWKLIRYHVKGQSTTQLFNLRRDPWEMTNLADDPAQVGRLHALDGELRRWTAECERA